MNGITKKIFVVLILLSFSYSVYSQSDTLNRVDKFGKKYGYWKKYQDNGKLLWEGRFYNGEPVGDMYRYYPNGKLESHSKYYPNSPKVETVTYHSNGKKASEGVFINKEKDGQWVYYSNKGILISKEQWKVGVLDGKSCIYSPTDGVLLEESTWQQGKLHGEFKTYYTTGQLRTSFAYNHNVIHGKYESFYVNGHQWTNGQYIDGFREGTWTTLDSTGRELKIEDFVKDYAVKTILGFQTDNQWIKLNANSIAYFYYEADQLMIQLYNKKKIPVYQTTLADIYRLTGVELFVFLSEQILSSYTAIRKVEDLTEDDVPMAKITLHPRFAYDVIVSGDSYQNIKSLLNSTSPDDVK